MTIQLTPEEEAFITHARSLRDVRRGYNKALEDAFAIVDKLPSSGSKEQALNQIKALWLEYPSPYASYTDPPAWTVTDSSHG